MAKNNNNSDFQNDQEIVNGSSPIKRKNTIGDNEDNMNSIDKSVNKNLAKQIQKNLDDIYRSTYYTDNNTEKYINQIRNQMDRDINGLMDRAKEANGGTNITSLYSRTLAKADDNTMKELRRTLEDDSLLSDIMDLYSQNVVVKDMDKEIDTICKYMPKLEEALDIKTDNVLCADHFNEDTATYINRITNTDNADGTTDPKKTDINDMRSFIDKYGLDDLKEEVYRKTAKYGEAYVYIVSYNQALSALTERPDGEQKTLSEATFEDDISDLLLTEDFVYVSSPKKKSDISKLANLDEDQLVFDQKEFTKSNLNESDYSNHVSVEMNMTGVIPSAVKEHMNITRIADKFVNPLLERANVGLGDNRKSYLSAAVYAKNMRDRFKAAANGKPLIPPESLTTDGLQDPEQMKRKENQNKVKIDIPGCIVKILDHGMVKPIYIDKTCLGYYYIETNRPMDYESQATFTSTLGGLRPRRTARENENMSIEQMDSALLMRIAKQISQKIDRKFINANQDLAQEIYTILKYNQDHGNGGKGNTKIRISFIPPSDIVASYFDFDEKRKRGRSDLHRSIFPAKLYSCLYISNTIALLTRGYDKRMYHVRQSVDTNITAVLLNVINQIKRSNFNLRQIENMNNILNVTGRFNDLVIPQNANGESPISFEVMPGQNIEIKTDFMNMLEEMAVNQTGVSLEMVNSRYQESTATHLTMTNSRFLIKIYNRQKKYEKILSRIYTKIYQYEYQTKDILKVELPPPLMLNFQNITQILATANDMIQNIVMMSLGTEQNEMVKITASGKLMKYYFKSFLPMDDINKIIDEAKAEVKAKEDSPTNGMPGQDMGAGGDMGGGMPQGGGY